MSDQPRERLNHLLDLAARGDEARAALLGELVDLLLDWPKEYGPAMRAPFEALLDRTARDVDAPALVVAARKMNGAFADILAAKLAVPADRAKEILGDRSGSELATACKGAALDRAAYSAIVLLTTRGGDVMDRLNAYDAT